MGGFDGRRGGRHSARPAVFGGNIAILQGGRPIYSRSFGWSAEDRKRAVTGDAVFSLFSVTKAFTNMLVFRAIERGQLTLTTPIHHVIPEFCGGLRNRIRFPSVDPQHRDSEHLLSAPGHVHRSTG